MSTATGIELQYTILQYKIQKICTILMPSIIDRPHLSFGELHELPRCRNTFNDYSPDFYEEYMSYSLSVSAEFVGALAAERLRDGRLFVIHQGSSFEMSVSK
jgi:hypothetical protein